MAVSSSEIRCRRPILLTGVWVLVGVNVAVAGPPAKNITEGVLVLRNGRVLAGHIQLVEEGYQVESPSGRVVLPRKLVEVEAENLVAAYRKLRARMPDRTASRHIVLARWCLSYGLNQQAMTEFREAERLVPRNATARTMIARLDPTLRSRSTVPTVRMVTAVMSRDAAPVESLGGLPRDLAATFVQKLQPLLSHRCGNGSCHGTSTTRRFQLESIGRDRSGFGVRTRKNLEAVLAEVSPAGQSNVSLLSRARKPHGSAGVRRTPRGLDREQLKMLESWVEQVVAARKTPRRRGNRGVDGRSASRQDSRDRSVLPKPGTATVDVFDPAAFNRETQRREAMRLQAAAAAAAAASGQGGKRPRAGN